MLKKMLCAVAVLCSSASLAASVKPLQILPHIIVPGGEFRVLVGRNCDGITPANTQVKIGSREVPLKACESAVSQGKGWLVLQPPLKGKAGDFGYAEGRQRLTIASILNDFSADPSMVGSDKWGRNVEVVPVIDNLVSNFLPPDGVLEMNLNYITSRFIELTNAQRDKIVANSEKIEFVSHRYPYESDKESYDGSKWRMESKSASYASQLAKNRNGSFTTPLKIQGCGIGSELYQLKKLLSMKDLTAAGLTMEAAEASYGSAGKLIGPATLGQPADTTNSRYKFRDPRERNAVSYEAIGLDSNTAGILAGANLKKARIMVIDSASVSGRMLKDQITIKPIGVGETTIDSIGHGSAIYKLIADPKVNLIDPGNPVFLRQACGISACAADKVIYYLCEATKLSRAGFSVVVNISFSSQFDNKLVSKSIENALLGNVAIVAGFGNDDSCDNRNLTLEDFCNGYPADLYGNRRAFYTVGAVEPHNDIDEGTEPRFNDFVDIRDFQRGMEYQGPRAQTKKETSTAGEPSIYAPGQFWMKPIIRYSGTNLYEGMSVYAGTSFSAPLVSAIIAIWKEKCGQAKQWPQVNEISRSVSNLNVVDARKCRWQDRKPTR